jgi:opacity protein-like surface antigen
MRVERHELIALLLTAVPTGCSSPGHLQARAEAGVADFTEEGGVSSQQTAGVGLSFRDSTRPLGWVADMALRGTRIQDDLGAADLTGSRIELDVGTRLYVDSGSDFYRPFAGLGVTIQRIHLDDEASSATAVIPGVYVGAGVEFALSSGLLLGFSYRRTAGVEEELGDDDEDTDLDSGAFLVSLGIGL